MNVLNEKGTNRFSPPDEQVNQIHSNVLSIVNLQIKM